MKMEAEAARPLGIKGILAAILLNLLWGANVVAIKTALGTFPSFWSGSWRMGAGVPTIGLWALLRGIPLLPPRSEWASLTALGVIMTVQTSLVYLGVNLTSAAYSAVLLNSYPIPTSLIAHFFVPGDHLSWTRLAGLVVAFSGISVLFLGRPDPEQASRPLLGNAICTTTAFLFGARFVFTKRIVEHVHPIRAIFWQSAFALPFYLATAVLMEQPTRGPVTTVSMLAILYQDTVSNGLCTILWITLVQRYRPGVLSVFGFLTPIFGVVFSAIAFSEKLSPALLAGVIAVAAGILLVAKQSPRPIAGASQQ